MFGLINARVWTTLNFASETEIEREMKGNNSIDSKWRGQVTYSHPEL